MKPRHPSNGLPRRVIDITGLKFNRLTAIRLHKSRSGGSLWEFLCDCGRPVIAVGIQVRSGATKSCGCWSIEKTIQRSTTHGKSKSRTRRIWHNMKSRCLYPRAVNYHNYGGRGIRVCDRWLNFVNFLTDMGECPEGKSLDRYPNNDGNYEPGNCRWASQQEQSNNKRTVRALTAEIERLRAIISNLEQ